MGIGGTLLSSYGARKEAKSKNKEEKKKTQAALGELTPEAMQGLMQKFYTQFMAQMNPQMQAVMQGISANLGRSGMRGAGVAEQFKAGVPGQYAQGALGKSFGAAMPIAQGRAGIQAGREISTVPSWMSIAGATLGSAEDEAQRMQEQQNENAKSFMGGSGGSGLMSMMGGCWVADAIYGPMTKESIWLRLYVNFVLPTSRFGRLMHRLYMAIGPRLGRHPRLCRLFKPLFDLALPE